MEVTPTIAGLLRQYGSRISGTRKKVGFRKRWSLWPYFDICWTVGAFSMDENLTVKKVKQFLGIYKTFSNKEIRLLTNRRSSSLFPPLKF